MPEEPIQPFATGEPVMLVDRKGRRFLKLLRAGHPMTIRGTVILADDLIGRSEGVLVGVGEPERFLAFRPTHAELVPLLDRPAEPIFAKDSGLIVARGDLKPGHAVVEIGVGAGLLSITLLRAVGPQGSLVSYELREDFADTARANVALYHGPAANWRVVVADARDGVTERGVDRVVVDIPDCEVVAPVVADTLRPGGVAVFYQPTVLQVKALRDLLAASPRFALAETFELLERSWHVEGQSVRPDHRMVAHTGFVTVVRIVAPEPA